MSASAEKSPDAIVKETVLSFLDALNKENFDAAEKRLSPEMRFRGVMGSRNGAEEYMADMRKMKFKYKINEVFVEWRDVCVICDIDMDGANITTCCLYHVKDGQIAQIQAIFDPRPLLNH